MDFRAMSRCSGPGEKVGNSKDVFNVSRKKFHREGARGRRGIALGKAEIENEDHNRKRLEGKTGKTSNRV